jgi:uncharacterized protein (DUF1501 family)
MQRKQFLKTTLKAGLIPYIINGLSIKAIANSPLANLLAKADNSDRVLVLIQLNGGNDGLNTVIPVDQYGNLFNARQNIIIPENKILKLTGTNATGFHPAMPELRAMYDNGLLSVVQDVGYPNPDFSHFRSTDIWLSASDSNQQVNTGWIGRFLDTKFPNFPEGYPNTDFPDPPAIQIGAMVSPSFQGNQSSLGISITDPNSFYQFVSGTIDPAPNTPAGHELTYVRLVAQQTRQYSGSIKNAATKNNPANLSTLYPPTSTNTLADQLKIVAQLIAGGLKTKVYMVSIGGFDTHAAQVINGATDTGTHAALLQKISVAINAFTDDIKKLGVADRVLGMTFSEFGRRIKSNASLGTDHGAAAPLFLFGTNVKGGILGNNPIINSNAGVADNVPMQFDFRSIYATILKDWFGISDKDLNEIMLKEFTTLPLISGSGTGVKTFNNPEGIGLFEHYPNPAVNDIVIKFSCNTGLVKIKLFNSLGAEIGIITNNIYQRGTHELKFSTAHLTSGTYYLQILSGSQTKTSALVVSRY